MGLILRRRFLGDARHASRRVRVMSLGMLLLVRRLLLLGRWWMRQGTAIAWIRLVSGAREQPLVKQEREGVGVGVEGQVVFRLLGIAAGVSEWVRARTY